MQMHGRRGDPGRRRQWQAAVQQWRRSGQSVREFCRAEGLRESAFYFWKRKLTRRGRGDRKPSVSASKTAKPRAVVRPRPTPSPAGRTRSQGEPACFLPVRVVSPAVEESGGGLEIALADGRLIRVRPGFDRPTLADVLAVLEGRPC